jgi:hypothetical protein
LVVVRISIDGSNIQAAGNEIGGSLSVNDSLREDRRSHCGSSWNAREVERHHQSVQIITVSRHTAARSSLSVLSTADLLRWPYLNAVSSSVRKSEEEDQERVHACGSGE